MLKQILDSESAAPASWRKRRRRTTLLTALLAAGAGLAVAAGTWALTAYLPAAVPWLLGAGGGLGLLGALAAGPHVRLAPRPTAVLVLVLLGLTAASGYRVLAAPLASRAAHMRDPNDQVVARVKYIAEELREARLGRENLTPQTGELTAFLKDMPNGPLLLVNPFGGPPQATTRLLPERGSPLPSAGELAAGREPVALGTKLGPGAMPVAGRPYTLRTWGAVAFDRDPVSGEFVLYGIGREGDQAEVVQVARGMR